ncbi:MAG: ATP-dependent DNA helicase [Candidatus Woesearchaeota archaeon]
MNIYFPHDSPREQQSVFMKDVLLALENKEHYIVHAPTGLGKTAAALAPALTYALAEKKTVFFLTSRYTQHKLAIQTLREMKKKHNLSFGVSDIIAKKSLCLMPGISKLQSSEFSTYCKKLRDGGKCKYYSNTRKKDGELTEQAEKEVEDLADVASDAQVLKSIGLQQTFCPYELAVEAARKAQVIIGDYYYIFHPKIRDSFFRKIQKDLKNTIVIVDEAHNLAQRVKDLASTTITTYTLNLAISEAVTFGCEQVAKLLEHVQSFLEGWNNSPVTEKIVGREWFMEIVEEFDDYDECLNLMSQAIDTVYATQDRSYIAGLYDFFVAWQGENVGFTRILSKVSQKNQQIVQLSYRCLDPQVLTKPILEKAHSVIAMSGTFKPIEFHRDTLGFSPMVKTRLFDNPFPQKNALHLIVPETSTKYSERSDAQYQQIAHHCSELTNTIPGNCAIFFPSYRILDDVYRHFATKSRKTVICEAPGLSKEERDDILTQFSSYKKTGAVLLAVASGSFGEGVDLPGDLLRGVIIVGLPLKKPDQETKELISYYDTLFAKGWDYGYIYPAFNTTLQNAGRCIRSSTDKGIIVYVDKRYAWNQYKKCFPDDIMLETTTEYKSLIREFFDMYNI